MQDTVQGLLLSLTHTGQRQDLREQEGWIST